MSDWPIEGPRSVFVGDEIRGGLWPWRSKDHKGWRVTVKLGLHDWGVSEHMRNLRFLRLAWTYHQLDLLNLAVVEAIAPRVEPIDYQQRGRTREGLRWELAILRVPQARACLGAKVLGKSLAVTALSHRLWTVSPLSSRRLRRSRSKQGTSRERPAAKYLSGPSGRDAQCEHREPWRSSPWRGRRRRWA